MKRRNGFGRFFYGRNGADQLYQVMMWMCLLLLIVNMFFGSIVLYVMEIALLSFATYRALSRNLYQRQKENQAFLRFFANIGKWFKRLKNKWRDRKTHVYKKCPKCRNHLRLPKIKGNHTVCCPCCNHRFEVNI